MKGSAHIPCRIVVDSGPDFLAHSFRGPHFTWTLKRLLNAFYWTGSANSLLSLQRKRCNASVSGRRILTHLGVWFEGVIYSSPKLMKIRHDRGMNVSVLVGRDPCCPRSLVVRVEKSNRIYRVFPVKP